MTTYKEVLDWLFVQIPNYQKQGATAYKPGLESIERLLNELNNPQTKFPSIHIAGTNGKGSTAHMIAAIYQQNGYKVGIFSSPHINDFRERIKINGEMISKEFVLDFVLENKVIIDQLSASFFEICTAMAFQAFAHNKVDIAVIETGLGGRLDSTNVLKPELSIITNIGLDHTQFLGDTLADIAKEKAGIIKPKVPVLISEKQEEVAAVFETIAAKNESELFYSDAFSFQDFTANSYQNINAAAAIKASSLLANKFPIDTNTVNEAIRNVSTLTALKGRLQLIQEEPKIFLDAAHNTEGITKLLESLSGMEYDTLHLIYGASNDKDLNTIFNLFPNNALYYFTEFNGPRTSKAEVFEKIALQYDLEFTLCKAPLDALRSAKTLAKKQDIIVVFGSFFLLEGIEDSLS